MLKVTPELVSCVKKLYKADSDPVYFAGGHNWSDGTLFEFIRSGQNYLVKFLDATEPGKTASMAERLDYLNYLSSLGIDIIPPIASEKGNLIETAELEGTKAFFAWKKVEGDHINLADPLDLTDFYRNWGSLIGRIHHLAQSYPHWQESLARDDENVSLISWQREWDVFYNWVPDAEVKQAWVKIREQLEAFPRHRQNFGFIHNDPHPGNILLSGGKIVLIDFDVSNYMWFITDIAICIYSEYSRCGFHSQHQNRVKDLPKLFLLPFLQGYLENNQLPMEEFSRLEFFLNYRRVLMFTVFYEQIQKGNPAHLQRMKEEIISAVPYLSFPIETVL